MNLHTLIHRKCTHILYKYSNEYTVDALLTYTPMEYFILSDFPCPLLIDEKKCQQCALSHVCGNLSAVLCKDHIYPSAFE